MLGDNNDTADANHVSRRATLQAIGGFGTLGATGVLSSFSATVEIPIVEHGDETLATTTVPSLWHEQVQAVQNLRNRLHDRHTDASWYDYVSQSAADNGIEGLLEHQITVYATAPSEAQSQLPEEIEGITIEVEESRQRVADDHVDSSGNGETSQHDCVPGGSYLHDNSSGSSWTATCIAERNGEYFLMTAAHPFGGCDDSLSGEDTYQGGSDSEMVGETYTYNGDYDVALVDQTGDINGIDNSIVGESDPVVGHVSESYCDLLISNGDTVHNAGVSTGTTQGVLEEKVRTESLFCQRATVDFLKTSTNTGGGDSGAPHYWVNDENGYIAMLGPHTHHTMNSGTHHRSFVPAAYAISDELNWNVGAPHSTC